MSRNKFLIEYELDELWLLVKGLGALGIKQGYVQIIEASLVELETKLTELFSRIKELS